MQSIDKNSDLAPQPLLFITGSGRCGSSLIHEIISRHRDVGFISNIDDNLPSMNMSGRYNNQILRGPIGRFTKKGRLRFAPSEAYNLISHHVSPIYKNSSRNLAPGDVTPHLKRAFQQFFLRRFEAQRKRLFAHKYTGWARAAFFKEIFPQAKFLHVVRDGRAVANSFLQMRWWTGFRGPGHWSLGELSASDNVRWESSDRSYVVLAGLAWKILIESFETDSRVVNDDCIKTIRYEDFLSEPVEVAREICAFSELPWNHDMERQMDKSAIRAGRERAYTKDLTATQVRQLWSLIGEKLEAYGYSE